jgi:DNA invertase Pin-like site-specific DNA recombinase
MRIGYARVSTADQNLDLQTNELRSAGCERIFKDYKSGATPTRPGLDGMLEALRRGDCVVVWRLDRLARSMQQLIELVTAFERGGIQLISLNENIDTTSPTGKLIFHIFGSIAEFERELIRERTLAGLTAARARGRKGGRKPVLSEEKKKTLDLLLERSKDFRAHARALGVSERTIRRYAQGSYRKAA